jgi:hypothetical protein
MCKKLEQIFCKWFVVMLNNKLNGYMCELLSISVKNEPSIKFVTDF